MSELHDTMAQQFIGNAGAVCDAVLRLRGEALAQELGRLAR